MSTKGSSERDESTLRSPFGNWPPDLESIPRLSESLPRITTDEARAGLAMRHELRGHFLHMFFALLQFCTFVSMIQVHTPINRVFLVNRGVSDMRFQSSKMEFMNIRSAADIEAWIDASLLPEIFPSKDDNHSALEIAAIGRIGSYNQVVGAVEFSILNAPTAACDSTTGIAAKYGACHDMISDFDISDGDIETRNTRAHPWHTLYLPAQDPAPVARYKQWQVEGSAGGFYIGLATRELRVKIATYNGELDVFSYLDFKLEFQPGGAIEPTYRVYTIPANPYTTSGATYLLDVVLGLLNLYLLVRRCSSLVKSYRQRTQWLDSYGFVEWLAIVLVIGYYIAWRSLCGKIFSSEFEDQVAALRSFYDSVFALPEAQQANAMVLNPQPTVSDFIDAFGPSIDLLYAFSIMTCLHLSVHVMATLQFHPTLSILSNTIVSSVKRLGSFAFVLLLVVVALATSGCVLFGPQLEAFSSLDRAMVTCINMLFTGYDYEEIRVFNDIAIVWYWLTQAIIMLVLANIMLAVIIAAHEDIVAATSHERSFAQEMLWVLDDTMRTTCLCRSSRLARFEERIAIDSTVREWTAFDIAQAVDVSESLATDWIGMLRNFASVAPSTEDADAEKRSEQLDSISSDRHRRIEERVDLIDAKLGIIVDYIRAQETLRMA
ncbi:Polycystin Cation Channel (PCC) Family [Achlya hypogyna]|uniref:Polycystin Cation Channel (PCC) Family n=1 Tax=Achlya hypogyna TaxID=1202772 RepID=A0A1V9YZ56_ACHHY|nr:Polycystin Cation Channel (PCC) Family [Achlya hypogyna]